MSQIKKKTDRLQFKQSKGIPAHREIACDIPPKLYIEHATLFWYAIPATR